jgi:hypothetical protein
VPPRTYPRGEGGGELIVEMQESDYTAETAPHAEKPHVSRQTGGGRGYGNFKSRFLKGQYLCKIESNAEGKERDTQHFKNLKRQNI